MIINRDEEGGAAGLINLIAEELIDNKGKGKRIARER